jgi:two-component system CheB/CheR fusion protein
MITLNEERQRLDAVLSSMADAVMMVDADGEPILTNAAFKQTFGERLPTLEDASGQRLPTRANPAYTAGRGETFSSSFTLQRKDGLRHWYEASGQPIRLGHVTGGVVVIRDVTDQSLRQLQEQFVALASHELRTPLAALRGSLQLMQRAAGEAPDERVARYLQIGQAQVQLLEELVEDLTDVVRVQTGQQLVARAPLDLVELTRSTVDLARTIGDGQEIRLDLPAEPFCVYGDRRRLQQVLLNLIGNAIQHGASERGVDVRVRSDASLATMEVRDYGAGITNDERAHIFERFYQTSRTGRGLGVGLYLVRAIVTAHDGTVDAHPTGEHGARFIVRLPIVE